ncbi:fasciclin-3 isoform X2 [Harmonia axyridis]|uniref:fasciclin-3 isoform X2 n=1 Tax=Harmonia axyridis TaxID=115357 RepID=UPI001E279129|nr:fasciclin-3 isoform X2 [Harmonia axyridis]
MEKAKILSLLVQMVVGLSLFQGFLCARVEITPSVILVLPGHNVTFVCRVAERLQYCRVEIPGEDSKNLNPDIPSSGNVKYYGLGLESGQCGFTINSVSERNNGMIKCTLGIPRESQESVGTMQLIVAKPPQVPVMEVSKGSDNVGVYKIHDTIHASCSVNDGRPAANISWFLDDIPILEDLSMPTIVEIAKENFQSKSQNLTRQLRASDNGKRLRCVAQHPAYPNGQQETSRQLDVVYPPQPLKNPLEQFGYIIGQQGVISITIEANPKPKIEWFVAEQNIKEGNSDSTGRIDAQPIIELEQGRYEVNLRMAAVQKEDTEKEYILAAQNQIGRQEYHVRISTNPEPEGLELGLGSLVGIVVAICILLMAVFLLIFAKTTGRWCFSGPLERQLGESDTESADGRPKDSKRNLIPIRLSNYFKKEKNMEHMQNKEDEVKIEEVDDPTRVPLDTTLATEQETNKDNKEGVVYAELDLISPGVKAVVKNDNDKTEYAEILYAPKEEDNK